LGFGGEIWQASYYDRRVRDMEEYLAFREYIHQNPVKKRLAPEVSDYPYSSGKPGFEMDEAPQRLKPVNLSA
jgi:hypothetical protein